MGRSHLYFPKYGLESGESFGQKSVTYSVFALMIFRRCSDADVLLLLFCVIVFFDTIAFS